MHLRVKSFEAYDKYLEYLGSPGVQDFHTLCLITDENQVYFDRLNITGFLQAASGTASQSADNKSDISALEKKVTDLEAKVTTLTSDVTSLKSRVSALEKKS